MPLPSPPSTASDPQVLADINTTPLIDVMLVLLIMLIITIPIQLHSVNLNLPVPSALPPAPPQAVQLGIAADGALSWGAEAVAGAPDLQARLHALAAQPEVPELHVRPDEAAAYRHVAAVLAAAQREGLQKIGVVNTVD
jgi:biopolymer transport protein ExbD